METIVIAISGVILKFIFDILKDKRKAKEQDNGIDSYPASEAVKEAVIKAKEWKRLKELYPELKVNPFIDPQDLCDVAKKYKIPLIWVVRLSNLHLISKNDNNEITLLPIKRHRALYVSGLCVIR